MDTNFDWNSLRKREIRFQVQWSWHRLFKPLYKGVYRMYNVPSVFGDSLFDSMFKDFDLLMKDHRFSYDDAFPPINLYMNKDDKACTFELALTGYKKDWLQVCIEGQSEKDRILIIKATVPEDKDEDGKQYVKRRMRVSSFEKKYRIPQGYDTDATEVSYEDGLLTVYIPVKQAKVFEPTVKQLEIN